MAEWSTVVPKSLRAKFEPSGYDAGGCSDMEILCICLKAIGITADLATLVQAFSTLLQREETYDATELFARCFRHAVEQRRGVLGRLARPQGSEYICVIESELQNAMQRLSTDSLSIESTESNDISRVVAPLFRDAISIPGHSLDEIKFDAQMQKIVATAIQQFVADLPLQSSAFREVVISHLTSMQLSQSELAAKVDALCNCVERIRDELADEPSADPTTLQFESARPEFRNPFRIVTAENFDHDYRLLARLFKAPTDYESIRSHDNLLIAGGRGCGKSMILKSLSVVPAVEIARINQQDINPDISAVTFSDSGLDYFGVYLKLFRAFFSQYTPDSRLNEEAAHVYFQHYFNMILLRALLQQVKDASQSTDRAPILNLTRAVEKDVVQEISVIGNFSPEDQTLSSLIKSIRQQEHFVTQYMTELRLAQGSTQYHGHYTTIDRFLDECCDAICRSVPDLKGRRIYFLLDEFENLTEFQQKVVNTLAKLRPTSLTLKIATRAGGLRAMDNLQGDPMQFPRDYHYVSLDYDIASKSYRDLLVDIAQRRLDAEKFTETNIEKLLPNAPSCSPSTPEAVEEGIKSFLGENGLDLAKYDENKWSEKRHQWREAFIFRINENRQKPRTYAGVNDFVRLSSGIISNFLELCKMAFYMATWEGIDVRKGEVISARTQNEAVYKTSEAAFDWISKNIADTGPQVSRLTNDLAAIVRHKLLYHTSEPEASRITLKDAAKLKDNENRLVCMLLDDAVRWSVLQTPEATKAYLPKHREDVRPSEYLFNRLLHPTLRISLNARWTTAFSVADLSRLCDNDTRTRKRGELLRKHSGSKAKGSAKSQPDDPRQLYLNRSQEVSEENA